LTGNRGPRWKNLYTVVDLKDWEKGMNVDRPSKLDNRKKGLEWGDKEDRWLLYKIAPQNM